MRKPTQFERTAVASVELEPRLRTPAQTHLTCSLQSETHSVKEKGRERLGVHLSLKPFFLCEFLSFFNFQLIAIVALQEEKSE